jgi:excisionase family DNA binding protein
MSRRRTWLTGAEVARVLHVSPKTVSRWAKQGLLPCGRTLGGHRRYDPAAIEQVRRQLTHIP